jgi:nitrite reductase/ring-hydroxylating ferredoxin subunit
MVLSNAVLPTAFNMKRNQFITRSCLACAGIASIGISSLLLESCASLPSAIFTVEKERVIIDKTELLNKKILLLSNRQLAHDILLVQEDNEITALRMICSHEEQPLTATADKLHCNAHGSTFNLKGEATREPAISSLKKHKLESNEQAIIIFLNKFL